MKLLNLGAMNFCCSRGSGAFIVICFLIFCVCPAAGADFDCPSDWYKFNTSCYKSYNAAPYRIAMDKCFRLLTKQAIVKRPYLANIESQEEMNFVMSYMVNNKILEMYVGANNIIKRNNILAWERLGQTNDVDKNLLCPDIYVDNSSYYCGFIKNMFNSSSVPNELGIDGLKEKLAKLNSNMLDSFCVNVSDCFISLPYLCEVNCTNQEARCAMWAEEYNIATPDTDMPGIYRTFRTTKKNKATTTPALTLSTNATNTSTTTTTTTTTTTPTTTTTTTTTKRTTTSRGSNRFITTRLTTTTTTTIYNPCLAQTSKCENNSTCIFAPFTNKENYKCECLPGFDGTYCERDERPCQPERNRCKNNSTCNQFGFLYNCTCLSGFEGFDCENNIDDCFENACENGAQCEDLINNYTCICPTFFYGTRCEFKKDDLVFKENVSRSFSVVAIAFIIFTVGFFVSLDALRFVFRIEPEGLSQERQLIRKKRLMKKIMEDMKNKEKRKKYRKYIAGAYSKDPFILKLEKTFRISYDRDLRYIDDDYFFHEGVYRNSIQS